MNSRAYWIASKATLDFDIKFYNDIKVYLYQRRYQTRNYYAIERWMASSDYRNNKLKEIMPSICTCPKLMISRKIQTILTRIKSLLLQPWSSPEDWDPSLVHDMWQSCHRCSHSCRMSSVLSMRKKYTNSKGANRTLLGSFILLFREPFSF